MKQVRVHLIPKNNFSLHSFLLLIFKNHVYCDRFFFLFSSSSFVPFFILAALNSIFSNQIFIIMLILILILISIPTYLNTFSSSYSLFL